MEGKGAEGGAAFARDMGNNGWIVFLFFVLLLDILYILMIQPESGVYVQGLVVVCKI